MATIQTINGPKDTSELGATLTHEHLNSGMGSFERLGYYNRDDAVRRGVEALQPAYDVGIRTVIDCTPLDLGRDEGLFQGIAGKTPMNVICATGVYRWVPMPYSAWDEDGAAAFMLREINDGIAGTSIRPGMIKLAWDIEYQLEPLRIQMEKMARGAARAAKASGLPITCHTRPADYHGDRLLDIFEEEGLDLRAVTIGHTNDSTDMDYVLRMAKRGATVGLDRFSPRIDEAEQERRARVALTLVEAGYAEQVCLSHDSASYSLNGGPASGGVRPENPRAFCLVSEVQIPWLKAHGVTDDQVDAMLVRSVRATFEAAATMKK